MNIKEYPEWYNPKRQPKDEYEDYMESMMEYDPYWIVGHDYNEKEVCYDE